MQTPLIGQPLRRVDGRLKVTGQARYAAEHPVPEAAHGVLVLSPVARGRLTQLDTSQAAQAPGVLGIVSHLNCPLVPGYAQAETDKRVEGQQFRLFFDDQIHFSNQPVAVVVADTLENAQQAARLVQATYTAETPRTDLAAGLAQAIKPKRSEDYDRGQAATTAPVTVEISHEYRTPVQVHNPMETHAAIARWQGNVLDVWNKTQAPALAQQDLAKLFGLPQAAVRVHSPFVGGAFGGSSRIWPPQLTAILAAKVVGRPVKVVNERVDEFSMVGFRPASVQRVRLAAQADGTLVKVEHEAFGVTSRYEEFTERILHPTKSGYACPRATLRYSLVPLDLSSPCWTRGPGETTGSFAIESAMDELAYALKLDPLALRLKNFADHDPADGRPWSSNYLRECYALGAERFGWARRPAAPRSLPPAPDGWLRGQGLAMGIYHASRVAATARARLLPDGSLLVQCATADAGPGVATAMTQIAADASGVAPANIRFELGDSALPPGPGQFGSHTTASVGAAVHQVCAALRQQLLTLAATALGASFGKVPATDLVMENGTVRPAKGGPALAYGDILQRHGLPALDLTQQAPAVDEKGPYSGYSFSAHFVEVHVQPLTREVRVARVVSAIDAGRIINHKTAQSQAYGAIAWGIGIALMEDAVLDHRYGRYTNHDLANYHVPTNADIPTAIDIIFTDQPDPHLDPIGAKGLGEIGLIGLVAAIANAVYHATGTRVRELPITPDKLV